MPAQRAIAAALLLASLACAEGDQDDGPTQPRVEPPANVHFDVTPLTLTDDLTGAFWMSWGDCNDDRLPDLARAAGGDIVVSPGGGAERRLHDPDPLHSANAGVLEDLDGDGRADLVLAGTELWMRPGLGSCEFGAPRQLGHLTLTGQPGQIQLVDINHDGLLDVATTMFGGGNAAWTLHVARGDGTFEPRITPATPMSRQMWDGTGYNTYGLFLRDIDGDGPLDLMLISDRNLAWFSWGDPLAPQDFTRDDELSTLLLQRDPMGVSSLDYDRDGRLDLFVAGTNGNSALWRNRGGRDLVDRAREAGVAGLAGSLGADGVPEDWTTLTLDVDFDGWLDLFVLRRNGDQVSMEPAGLHINRHDRTFADLGKEVFGPGLAAKTMSCVDRHLTGRMSCWVQQVDAGPLLVTNRTPPRGGFLGLTLEGTISGSVVQEALVTVLNQPLPQVAVESPDVTTDSLHSRQILLGIGELEEARVRVDWPSGLATTQTLDTGRYHHLVEPRVFEVERRVLPADGVSEVRIVFEASLKVDKTGAGQWAGPDQALDDGRRLRVLRAPDSPDTARIRFEREGALLKTQPLIRFE